MTNQTRTRKETRPQRVPVSGNRNILTAPKRKGYVRRFVNDAPGRIDKFLLGGWSLVQDENMQIGDSAVAANNKSLTTSVKAHVGSKDGQVLYAYLMEIPEEFYKEDQAAKMAEVDAREEAMLAQHGEEGRYGDVKIGRP